MNRKIIANKACVKLSERKFEFKSGNIRQSIFKVQQLHHFGYRQVPKPKNHICICLCDPITWHVQNVLHKLQMTIYSLSTLYLR